MTQRCEKVVFCFVCFFRRDLCRFQFPGAQLIGEVAHDLGKTAKLARSVAKRRQHNFRVKCRSIFANAQPLVPDVAFARRLAQIALRFSRRNLRCGVETGKVFSDDFRRRVLLDLFGA